MANATSLPLYQAAIPGSSAQCVHVGRGVEPPPADLESIDACSIPSGSLTGSPFTSPFTRNTYVHTSSTTRYIAEARVRSVSDNSRQGGVKNMDRIAFPFLSFLAMKTKRGQGKPLNLRGGAGPNPRRCPEGRLTYRL